MKEIYYLDDVLNLQKLIEIIAEAWVALLEDGGWVFLECMGLFLFLWMTSFSGQFTGSIQWRGTN